jgi:hypothetical protein
MMTTPATAIKDEVRWLIVQIEVFGQPASLAASQLREFHDRSEKLKMLCQELDGIGARSVMEQLSEMASLNERATVRTIYCSTPS